MPVTVSARGVELKGDLQIPAGAKGIVLFAHGSGSSRLSPRNRFVAEALNLRGLGTLLIDLLTAPEERADDAAGRLRFDIPLLAGRLAAVSEWLSRRPETRKLPVAYFGASTGAAAALSAATVRPERVFAVVSRGGRPDLALEHLAKVTAPTLLIVGEGDPEVIGMNEAAASLMRCERRIEIVPEATHLFEEPGALESVARLAGDWLLAHLPGVVSLRPNRT
jgi:dienelactone hydrolase